MVIRQRELLVRGRLRDYHGGEHSTRIEGTVVAIADILGDWREEIITSVPGELRIYTTTIPATDRRVCLMQDPIYRLDVAGRRKVTSRFQVSPDCRPPRHRSPGFQENIEFSPREQREADQPAASVRWSRWAAPDRRPPG
jgi:hypothetical protein